MLIFLYIVALLYKCAALAEIKSLQSKRCYRSSTNALISATLANQSLQFKQAMESLSSLHIDNINQIKNIPQTQALQALREHECMEGATKTSLCLNVNAAIIQ